MSGTSLVPVVPWQNGSWNPAKQSVITGTHPPPPGSPKKSHGLFRPGAGLFLRPSFSAGKKKDPRAGSTPPPRRGRGTSPAVRRRRIPRHIPKKPRHADVWAFSRRPALPEESGAAAKREAEGVRDLPRSCGSVAKRLLEPHKSVGKHGQKPPPPGSPKKSHGFFGPGQAFFFVLLFRPGKRRTPVRAAPPAAGAARLPPSADGVSPAMPPKSRLLPGKAYQKEGPGYRATRRPGPFFPLFPGPPVFRRPPDPAHMFFTRSFSRGSS